MKDAVALLVQNTSLHFCISGFFQDEEMAN